MTPSQLAKSETEHGHQAAVFAYAAVANLHGFNVADQWAAGVSIADAKAAFPDDAPVWPLEWMHAIGNGGSRGDNARSRAIRGGQMKAEGTKAGVADIFLPFPMAQYCGLYIEMKKPSVKPKKATSKGGLSDEQIKFKNHVQKVGFGWIVCYSWEEATIALKQYFFQKG